MTAHPQPFQLYVSAFNKFLLESSEQISTGEGTFLTQTIVIDNALKARGSAVAEKPHYASCLSAVSFNNLSAISVSCYFFRVSGIIVALTYILNHYKRVDVHITNR